MSQGIDTRLVLVVLIIIIWRNTGRDRARHSGIIFRGRARRSTIIFAGRACYQGQGPSKWRHLFMGVARGSAIIFVGRACCIILRGRARRHTGNSGICGIKSMHM